MYQSEKQQNTCNEKIKRVLKNSLKTNPHNNFGLKDFVVLCLVLAMSAIVIMIRLLKLNKSFFSVTVYFIFSFKKIQFSLFYCPSRLAMNNTINNIYVIINNFKDLEKARITSFTFYFQ